MIRQFFINLIDKKIAEVETELIRGVELGTLKMYKTLLKIRKFLEKDLRYASLLEKKIKKTEILIMKRIKRITK